MLASLDVASLNSLITLFSNNQFVVAELVTVAFILWWARKIEDQDAIVLLAWGLVSVGYMWRIGYWSLAIHDAPVDPTHLKCTFDLLVCEPWKPAYPKWAIDWRWTLVIPSSMVVAGAVLFIGKVQGLCVWQKFALGGGMTTLALAATVVG